MVTPVLDFPEGHVPTTGDQIFAGIITLFLISPYLYSLFLYIMQALGLRRIAKRRGIHHAWLAWLPCAQNWLLGAISDQYLYVTQKKHRYWRIVLLLLSFLQWLSVFLSTVYIWALPLDIMNLIYKDFLRAFLHTPWIAENLFDVTTCLVVALLVFRLFPLYRLYQSAVPRHRLPLLILNILLPISPAITIFAVRDYDKGMPPRHKPIPDP